MISDKSIAELTSKFTESFSYTSSQVIEGEKYNNFKSDNARKLIEYLYKAVGLASPVMLIAENPYEMHLMYSHCENLIIEKDFGLRNKEKVFDDIGNQFEKIIKEILNPVKEELESQVPPHLLRSWRLLFKKYYRFGLGLISPPFIEEDRPMYANLKSSHYDRLTQNIKEQLRTQYQDISFSKEMSLLTHSKDQTIKKERYHLLGAYSDYFLNWINFLIQEVQLSCSTVQKFKAYYSLFQKACISEAYFSEDLCVISKYPKKVYCNPLGQLHNVSDSCIDWGKNTDFSGIKKFCIDGSNFICEDDNDYLIRKKIFSLQYTEEDFSRESKIREPILKYFEERNDRGILSFLATKLSDKQIINHPNGVQEELSLHHSIHAFDFNHHIEQEKNKREKMAWLEVRNLTTQEHFLFQTDPQFTEALEAVKFHRPLEVIDYEYQWISSSSALHIQHGTVQIHRIAAWPDHLHKINSNIILMKHSDDFCYFSEGAQLFKYNIAGTANYNTTFLSVGPNGATLYYVLLDNVSHTDYWLISNSKKEGKIMLKEGNYLLSTFRQYNPFELDWYPV